MTQTTPTGAAAKPKKAASDVESAFEAFNFNMPNAEIPAAFRDAAEKAVTQARETYSRLKAVAEDASDVMEETYETARDSAVSIGLKTLEMSKANADASFAFCKDLFAAKTFADAIEIQTAFARKQFDAVSSQMRELAEAQQKAALELSKPSRNVFEKAFKEFKVA